MNGEMIAVLMVGLLGECRGISLALAYKFVWIVLFMRVVRQEIIAWRVGSERVVGSF